MRKMNKILFVTILLFSLATPSAFAGYIKPLSQQDVTAYTASQKKWDGSTRYTHSGQVPQMGFVAVRKDSSNNPHVPFGTTVVTPVDVNIDGTYYNNFSVQDTGIASTQTYYAIDIWWGFCRTDFNIATNSTVLGCSPNDSKYVSASNFGEEHWILEFFTP
jgi:hypothetical protein